MMYDQMRNMINPTMASAAIKAKNDLAITARLAHWSVRGQDYYESHLMFERIYDDASCDMDTLVEVLRGLGYTPTFAEFAGPGGQLPGFSKMELVDVLLDQATTYYSVLVRFRESLEGDNMAIGLINLLEDLCQTSNVIIYLLSASKGN